MNHNVVPLLYLHLYIWSFCSMALCSSLWQTPAQAALWKVSMGIAFEEITFDSNLQWGREWQVCICLETNAKNIKKGCHSNASLVLLFPSSVYHHRNFTHKTFESKTLLFSHCKRPKGVSRRILRKQQQIITWKQTRPSDCRSCSLPLVRLWICVVWFHTKWKETTRGIIWMSKQLLPGSVAWR